MSVAKQLIFCEELTTLDGATQDYDMIMRFLNPFLFPKGEREIVEWMATGISLGGNAVWRMLREGELSYALS